MKAEDDDGDKKRFADKKGVVNRSACLIAASHGLPLTDSCQAAPAIRHPLGDGRACARRVRRVGPVARGLVDLESRESEISSMPIARATVAAFSMLGTDRNC